MLQLSDDPKLLRSSPAALQPLHICNIPVSCARSWIPAQYLFRRIPGPRSCRDHVEELVENCQRRKADADPRLVAQLYDEFVALDREADAVRKERNENAASMKASGQVLSAANLRANC